MKTVLSYPGTMLHAQQIAAGLAEAGWLQTFVTTFAYRTDGALASLLGALPGNGARRLDRQLARRAMPDAPQDLIRSYPGWEIVRTIAQKAGMSPPAVDRIWDLSSQSFDRTVAARHVPQTSAIHAFEYTALASFRRAEREGVARVLHLPALNNLYLADLHKSERAAWSELNTPYDAYFERLFPARQARRDAEVAAADLLVCNSSLTARSHIAAGADPRRVVAVPLGAPPPIPEVRASTDRERRPLRVISAGNFSLNKGAHYLLDAWRALKAGPHAVLDVYGRRDLPERAMMGNLDGINFYGSVPQDQLFAAFEQADVLIFPTLADGFGLVVTEALSRGLPVITTDQAGAADLIGRENGIVIPARDPAAIVGALRWCLDSRPALQAMRFAALETARSRQWVHYRRDLMAALDGGLRARGYSPLPLQTPSGPVAGAADFMTGSTLLERPGTC